MIPTADVETALAVANEIGLKAERAKLISSSSRSVILLDPCHVLAKVAPLSELSRSTTEVLLARHIQRRQGPAVPPLSCADAGPHVRGESVVSLWEYAPSEADDDTLELAATAAYTELRVHLEEFTRPLPRFSEPIVTAREALSRGHVAGLPPEAKRLVERELSGIELLDARQSDFRVLHGDPHIRNLTASFGKVLWIDLKSACLGPIEWDLSALPRAGHFGSVRPKLLARLRRIRSACVVVWCSLKPRPSENELEAITFHLDCLGCLPAKEIQV